MSGEAPAGPTDQVDFTAEYESSLATLDENKDNWARLPVSARLALLAEVKDGTARVAKDWAEESARRKGLRPNTPMTGEEWIVGPYAALSGVSGFIHTLAHIDGKRFLDRLHTRELASGQLGVRVLPSNIWDRLLLSGVSAEVWMQEGVNRENLRKHTASAYDIPASMRKGRVALVLGAGNIAAITFLDVLQKLIVEHQVVILKMNPINEFLADYFEIAMKPFIDAGFVRIVKGDGKAGAYLCEHPLVEEIHITGSNAVHDAIVWGVGAEAEENRRAGTPKNGRRITSELGSVSPTIVVPGPWSAADIRFQAENLATMKLHNSGHNCISCQAIVMPKGWAEGAELIDRVKRIASGYSRPAWYPGSEQRLTRYGEHGGTVERVERGPLSPALLVGEISEDAYNRANEVFAPALGIKELDAPDAETYLEAAIEYANERLWGTLGAQILIHPKTIKQIGKKRFETIISRFRYGTIGINGWCGMGFLITACPWGAFPGHTLEDVGSGIGTVHNSFMLEKTERVVLYAPWRPFPRGLLSFQFALLPRPPFFITNRRQHRIGQGLTEFQYKPSLRKLPGLLVNALLG